jgi:hypothetical protein
MIVLTLFQQGQFGGAIVRFDIEIKVFNKFCPNYPWPLPMGNMTFVLRSICDLLVTSSNILTGSSMSKGPKPQMNMIKVAYFEAEIHVLFIAVDCRK